MSTTKVLFPFNFTGYDRKAMDFIIQTFAPLKDHEITLLHAYAPLPKIENPAATVMERAFCLLISWPFSKNRRKHLG